MTQKIETKSGFATLAGVNPSTITRLALTILKAAMVGKRIDANHPVAVAYLADQKRKSIESPATGIDPLYESAVAFFNGGGRRSISALQRELKIGYNRAVNIVTMIDATGVAPKGIAPTSPPPPPAATTHVPPVTQSPPSLKPEDLLEDVPENIREVADMSLRELAEKFGTVQAFKDWLDAVKKIEDINAIRLKNDKTRGDLISRSVTLMVVDIFNSSHLKMMTDGAKSIAKGVIAKHLGGADTHNVEAYVSEILGSFIKPVKNKIRRALSSE